jgi:hypothetical protein
VIFDVASELFVRHSTEFDFVIFGQPTSTTTGTIDGLLNNQEGIKKVYQVDDLNHWTGPANDTQVWSGKAGLIFVSKLQSLIDFLIIYGDVKAKLLFFIPEFLKFDDSKVLSSSSENNENYFLIESKSKIELKSFRRWTEKSCEIKKFVSINTFDLAAKKWTTPLTLPEKFSNYNGCSLKIYPNFILLPTFDLLIDNGLINMDPIIQVHLDKRDAREREIVKIYSEQGNFSLIEVMGKKEKFDVEIVLGYDAALIQRCGALIPDYNLMLMVSAPEPYTNFEKMILPFDSATWFYLIGVLCAAFAGIFFLNLTPKFFRDLVYGKDVNMPSFNVIGTLFGIGQTKLPDNNFGRIILMTFIIFCLIFRTAYQGELSMKQIF